MSKILASKIIEIDGSRISFAAGLKHGRPIVVLGVTLGSIGPLKDISIEYAMKSIEQAITFVNTADKAVALRGKQDCENRFSEVIAKVSDAFRDDKIMNFNRANPFEVQK